MSVAALDRELGSEGGRVAILRYKDCRRPNGQSWVRVLPDVVKVSCLEQCSC